MNIMMLGIAVLLPTATGALLVSLLTPSGRRQAFPESVLLGYGLGMGLLTFGMFLLALLRIPFSFGALALPQAVVVVFLAVLTLRSHAPADRAGVAPERRGRGRASTAMVLIGAIVLLWVLAKILFVISEGLTIPVHAPDSVETISSGAKFFFYERGLALDGPPESFLGRQYRTYLSYPLHPSLIQVWFSLCLGEAHEVFMKAGSIFYFIGIVGLVFFSLRRRFGALFALMAAFFVSSAPLLTYHSLTAYADLPLSYYVLAAALGFMRYADSRSAASQEEGRGALFLTGIALALAFWTKLEGALYGLAFSAALIVFIFRRSSGQKAWQGLASFFLPLAAVYAAWLSFLWAYGIPLGRGEEFSLARIHWEVLPMIWSLAIHSANFNIIFPFFFLMLVLGVRPLLKSPAGYLYGVILSVMAMFLFIYLTTDNYKWVMNLTAVNRNILTFIPAMYYVAALTVSEMLRRGESAGQKSA